MVIQISNLWKSFLLSSHLHQKSGHEYTCFSPQYPKFDKFQDHPSLFEFHIFLFCFENGCKSISPHQILLENIKNQRNIWPSIIWDDVHAKKVSKHAVLLEQFCCLTITVITLWNCLNCTCHYNIILKSIHLRERLLFRWQHVNIRNIQHSSVELFSGMFLMKIGFKIKDLVFSVFFSCCEQIATLKDDRLARFFVYNNKWG